MSGQEALRGWLQEAPDSTATAAGDANGDDAHAGEGPLAAPRLDKRQGESNTEKLHAETMYVREYERGRVVRNTPIQRPEIIAMLSSLIGETQAVAKRSKVCSYRTSIEYWFSVFEFQF